MRMGRLLDGMLFGNQTGNYSGTPLLWNPSSVSVVRGKD